LAGPCRFMRPRLLTESVMAVHTKVQKATDKKILPLKPENIPDELKMRPQWVLWKAVWKVVDEKPDKVPYSAESGRKASSTDLLTWSTFENACEALEANEYSGLGFVFSSGDPYTGIDLDDCVEQETGEIKQWALEIVRYFDSYTELSVTGTGVHIIVRGDVPNRRKDKIEVYSSKRFFTMTGHTLEFCGD
jgi:putative DNA primase/helicase